MTELRSGPPALRWTHAGGTIDCSRGHLVGIVNATPDSFTDEGAHFGVERSVAHGLRLAAQGASVVEVGGESLRFSPQSPVEVEIERVVPVVRELVRRLEVPVAVDTFKAPVAEAAIEAGAGILNDPTGLRDPAMLHVAAASRVGVVLTHFVGPPKVRPASFADGDLTQQVLDWARRELERAAAAGIDPERIVVDPGVGLGKSPAQDLELLRRIGELTALGRPIFVPISNKKVIGAVTGAPAKQRLAGTAAGLVWCRSQGATIFRVHNVRFLRRALEMADALVTGAPAAWHDVVR
ncbi:MAG: dihydropteroate synthase [Miltoncostaeaceae bacterium]|nr:dihydropteroate synthase [Miltoncostaeaceae bacterium]